MYSILKPDGIIEAVVPNHELLAMLLVNENNGKLEGDFELHDTILTTEFCNEPDDPHASLWSKSRIKYYMTRENLFDIKHISPCSLDGRNVYLQFVARKKDHSKK